MKRILKSGWKRIISFVLVLTLLMSTLPMAVFAQLLENDAEYNEEILTALSEVVGSDEEAEKYYEILQQYGLLEEDGSAPESWEIWLDGEQVELSDIKALLADENCDLDRVLLVDSVPITLGEIKTILEIEEYIAYLRETYFTDHQWTAEQRASLMSLVEQIDNEGIMLLAEGDNLIGESGINHSARVSVETSASSISAIGGIVNVTYTVSGALDTQKISFDVAVISASSGSLVTSETKNVTITGNGSSTVSVKVNSADTSINNADLWNGQKLFFVQASNIKNALFSGDKLYDTQKIAITNSFSFPSTSNYTLSGSGMSNLSAGLQFALKHGIANKMNVSISANGIQPSGNDRVYLADSDKHYYQYLSVSLTANGTSIAERTVGYSKDLPSAFESQQLGNLGDAANWYSASDKSTALETPAGGTSASLNYSGSQTDIPDALKTASSISYSSSGKGQQYSVTQEQVPQMIPGTTPPQYIYYPTFTPALSTYTISSGYTVQFTDTNVPTVQAVDIPSNTFRASEVIPITVTFSEQVSSSDVSLKLLDGTTLTPAESNTTAKSLTFVYTVKDADNTYLQVSQISGAKDISGNSMSTANRSDKSDNIIVTPYNSAAITGITSGNITAGDEVITVKVNISNNEKLTTWLAAECEPMDGGGFQTKTSALAVSIDGGTTKYPLVLPGESVIGQTLTAEIPVGKNSGGERSFVPELYVNGEIAVGKAVSVTQSAFVPVEASDVTTSLTIKNADGEDDYVFENGKEPVVYVQSGMPKITASFVVASGKNYTFADTGKVTTADASGTFADENADFAWQATTDNVVNLDIQNNGSAVISPKGSSGSTKINLLVRNGGVDGYQYTIAATYDVYTADGKYDKGSDTLTFASGLTPFLEISGKKINSVSGKDATVYWMSNLSEKGGDSGMIFTITAQRGNSGDAADNKTITLLGTPENPTGSVTIPGDFLTFNYAEGASNTFTVTVSAEYAGVIYSDTAEISLESAPANVAFEKLPSYYITDAGGSVNISWRINNFDKFSTDDSGEKLFEFEVMKNGTSLGKVNEPGTETSEGSGVFNGTYTIDNIDVTANTKPDSYRDVYTVTIRVKNGTDSTWSFDSFMLYVYDAEALKIMVDGKTAGSSLTMSNINEISKMSQSQILSLKRDIYLKNIISVNYGEYAWTEVADQIAWASSNNGAATLNYQQGTLYEDINNFSYVSYRPTTDLGLSGISNGKSLISAVHKLTGMKDELNVNVETLENKLYLFQCYPQVKVKLSYTNGDGETKTHESDETGAAAIYEESGIASDVYCVAETADGITYLGTFYNSSIKTGEGDWTKLEKYPCNNLELRRAAYAYMYLKTPEDKPFTGDIIIRGGVYVNGTYRENGLFGFNSNSVTKKGNEDNKLSLGKDGRLEIVMDQTQWGLPDNAIRANDEVSYVFQIELADDDVTYYPMFITINATENQDAFVGNGEAVVNFRKNAKNEKHSFIAQQVSYYSGYSSPVSLLNHKGNVGPTDALPESYLNTVVMWWGDNPEEITPKVQLTTDSGKAIAAENGQFTLENSVYPFSDMEITQYEVKFNAETLNGIAETGKKVGLRLDYYKDGEKVSRQETLNFTLVNMLELGKVEESSELADMIVDMGNATGTSAGTNMDFGDEFVQIALNLVGKDGYTEASGSAFKIRIVPTADPTKFLGLMEVNVGNSIDKQVSAVYNRESDTNYSYKPGLGEIMMLTGRKSPMDYSREQLTEFKNVSQGKGKASKKYAFGGYAETLIYYNYDSGKWEMQSLSGGFNAGGGMEYTWRWNTMVGPIPFTTSLSIGGMAEISYDTLAVAYRNDTTLKDEIGTDMLTELRIYLYLKFFAGVGIDYAVIAFKLGIYGQIDLDMQFKWLNRPYMYDTSQVITNYADGLNNQSGESRGGKMNGQHFEINGQIGLQFVLKFLFISYEKILFSYSFNLLDESTGQWETIHTSWEKNQAAKQAVISELLSNGSASLMSVGGQRMMTLNLAPTLESRAYVDEGSYWNDGGISLFALDRTSALENLHYNTYPYANPVVSEDGYLVAYLADMGSTDVTDTRAAFATKNGNSYTQGESGDTAPIDNGGEGDTQVSLAGTKDFAVSAWARQTESLEKDEGSVITDDDQMILINSSEVYAAVYNGNSWTTTQLTGNSSPDLAPVVAAGDGTAIVAWRAVSTSGAQTSDEAGNSFAGVTNFDEKDTILYKVYDGSAWGETKTLYNGTSGAVKGIVASMMDDGTAAVAYTLDGDKSDTTITDREVYYSVIDKENGNEVVRNVRATNDAYLDENPQLATVKFPSADNEERFVLGWYAEQGVASDDAAVMDSGSDTSSGETTSDIRLIDFNASGVTEQLLPDSISQVSASYGVAITPTFRFTKGAETINDLSILWVQRAEGMTSGETASADTVEKDVLKGVKFYTYGENSEMIRFTGAVDVAEMEDGTLIDHFDAYVSDAENNEIKAVILGTTYGADGVQTVTGQTVAGDTVQYNVPSSTTSMYTATETYTDKIEVPAVIAEYETVKKGGKTQIQFTIENNGIHAVKQLNIKVGGTETVYGDETENSELNLLPGSSIQLYADYDVPADEIVDPEYVVTATFDSSVGASGDAEAEKKAEGVIYLDLPDVEITDTTIVKEENGERTVQVKLNNASDATLNKNDRKVKISFYADATYEKEISALPAIEIADSDSLEMIDEGGFSVQTTFNVQEYLTEISEDSENPLTEIPNGGITVYVKSEIIEGDESIPEPISSNNYGYFVCENLKARTGKDVSITTDLSVSESGSTVDVSLQNNSLSATATGNVIVTLLDEGGNVLDMKQSYTGEGENGGLLTLGSEQKSNVQFSFDDQGASVQVMYSSMVMDDDNTTLTNLSFTNIPDAILSNFVWNEDAGQYEYSVEMDGLTATTVIATMESTLSRAHVSVDGGEWSEGSVSLSNKVDLEPGSTHTIKVRAEAHNKTAKIYALTVKNNAYSVTAPTFVPDDYGVETFEYGYAAFHAKPITIAETLAAVDKVELTGDNADCFELIKGDSSDRDYSVKPKDGLDAGTYNATVTATYSSGETASGAISFVVVPKVIDAVTLTNKVYTGSTLTADIPENDGYTVVENKGGINVGKCRVELALSNTNNYVWYDNTTTNKELWFDIIKADSVITPGKGELSATYGDIIEISAMVSKAPSSRNTFSLMAVEPVKDKVKFYCGENLLGEAEVTYASEYDDAGIVIFEYNTSDKLLKIGENTVTAVYGGSINLNDTQSSSIKVTLGTKDITVEITPNGGTYADTITAATAEPVDFIDGYKPDVTLTYTGTANDGTEINSTDVPSKAGNYVVSATVEDKYYNLTGTNTAEFVINKGTFTSALSAAEGSISARPGKVILEVTMPADATGTADVYEGETKLATLTLAETNKYTFVPTEERNAYSFTVKYPGDANYTASESAAFAYDFSKSNQTELAIADVGEKTFGNEAFALSVSGGSGTGAVSYAVTSGSSVSVDENGNITILSAGESIITVTKAGDNDYNEAVTTVTINIAQAQPSANTEKATTARLRRGRALKNASISKGEFFALDGETVLEGTFTWIEPEKTLSEDSTERIKFTPTDTNYAEIEFDVAVDTYSGGGGGSSSSTTTATYTVTFETNGGSKIDSVKVTKNSTVSEPAAPTKDGYTFDGWYTDKELIKAYDFDTKVTKAITLYAKWTEDKKDDTDDKTDDKTDTPDAPVWENPFEDVKSDDWYYKDVEYAVKNGLFNGTTTTTFTPNGIITRAMMVTVLYRAEGEPTVTGTTTFEDVDTGAYYAKAVVWGQQNGIIKGYSETEFAPDQNITREQIAAIMHRYAQYKGYDVSVGENTNILSYSDYDSISEYAIASMQYAVGSGLMKGKTTSTLNPLDNATRAEIAAILHRFIEANK